MAKLGIIFFIAAASIWVSPNRAEALPPSECNQSLEPMVEALSAVVMSAEKAAENGNFRRAAAIVANYLETHKGETHPYPYYDAGYFFHQDGDCNAAIVYLKKAAKLNPCFTEAWQLLASLYRETGENKLAATALEKAVAITDDPRMGYQTAVLWLEAEEPEKALTILEKRGHTLVKKADWHVATARAHQALEHNGKAAEAMALAYGLSKDPEQLYQCAVFWLEAGRPERASSLLRRLTGTASSKSHWLAALSKTQKALKKKEAAAKAMERAARVSRDPKLLFHAAWLWLDADRPKKALPLLKKLAERRRPRKEWLLGLSNTYMILNKSKLAAGTMDRVVKLDPKSEYLYSAGVLWLHAERPGKALRQLISLCQRSPAKARWFVALAHARFEQKETVKAAKAMERAVALSGDPEHACRAGLMWLAAKRADAALRLLVPLSRQPRPKAHWLVALSNAWVLKEDPVKAAVVMEQAARVSRKPEHMLQAARLWLAADQPKRALPLLETLTRFPSPRGEWYITLSNCCLMLEKLQKAARAMEKGAEITQKGGDYYRAGMLWLQDGNSLHGISLLKICAAKKPVKQKWLVSLARALMDSGLKRDALPVMEQTALLDPKVPPAVKYEGAVLWLHLERKKKALPVLKTLCASKNPSLDWLVSLVKTHVDLKQMAEAEMALKRLIGLFPENPAVWRLAVWVGVQKTDYAEAAAAMAVVVRLVPPDHEQMKEMANLYHMAGVPVKAAAMLRKTWGTSPKPEDWDRLANLYLSGHRYEMALAAAKSAVKARATRDRWKTVGAIAFRLQRFEESYHAYRRSADLGPDADICLKAGYAALKMDNLDEAARLFKEATLQPGKNSKTSHEAHRNLAFIKKMKDFLKENSFPPF